MSKLNALGLPPVSREFIAAMKKAFPGPRIQPGADRDKIMWDQAQAEVVKWVEHYADNHTLVSSDPADLNKKADEQAPKPKGWFRTLTDKARKAAAIVVVGLSLLIYR